MKRRNRKERRISTADRPIYWIYPTILPIVFVGTGAKLTKRLCTETVFVFTVLTKLRPKTKINIDNKFSNNTTV